MKAYLFKASQINRANLQPSSTLWPSPERNLCSSSNCHCWVFPPWQPYKPGGPEFLSQGGHHELNMSEVG